MGFDGRLSSGFAAFALIVATSTSASAQGSRASVGEHKINPCSIYGSDFVPVEGTNTCARIGGHIRVEIGVGNGLRNGFARSDSDGTRPAALNSDANGVATDPGYEVPSDSRTHLRVRELPGARDLFAR
ncbi:MAG: porin [Methylobacteriaceae bacterium]|nr:porin [Methylobacteriaceae bacterium]